MYRTAYDIEGYRIPFKYDGLLYPLPVIQAIINDEIVCSLVLDTGSNIPLLINESFAKQCGLNSADMGKVLPTLGAIRKVQLRSVQFQGTDAQNHLRFRGAPWGYVANLSPLAVAFPESIAGIVGAPVLREAVVLFDFARNLLTLNYSKPSLSFAIGQYVPLKTTHNVWMVQGVTHQKVKVSFMVDTGDASCSIPIQAMRGKDIKTTATMYFSGSDGGFVFTREFLIPYIKIGSRALTEIVCVPSYGTYGTLGMDALTIYSQVLFDLPHQRMVLSEPRKASRLRGETGITLLFSQDGCRIAAVAEWSPARHTSLKVGDKVIAIDKHPIAGLPPVVVRRLLDGFAGAHATLRVERNSGASMTVRFPRVSVFEHPSALCVDCDLLKKEGEPLTVLHVSGSNTTRVPLTPGDQLLQINGRITTHMGAEDLMELLTDTRTPCEIQIKRHHSGEVVTLTVR